MRIAPKSASSTVIPQRGATPKPGATSFLDTLTSASDQPVGRSVRQSCEPQARSDRRSTEHTSGKGEDSSAASLQIDINPKAESLTPGVDSISTKDGVGNQRNLENAKPADDLSSGAPSGPVTSARNLQDSGAENAVQSRAADDASMQSVLAAAPSFEGTVAEIGQPLDSTPGDNPKNETSTAQGASQNGDSVATRASLDDSALHSKGVAKDGLGRMTLNQTPSVTSASKSEAAGTMGAADKGMNTGARGSQTPSRDTQANSQQHEQHFQVDASQLAAAAARTHDGGTQQIGASVMAMTPQENVQARSTPGKAGDVPRSTDWDPRVSQEPLDSREASGLSGIQAANIIHAAGQTEMRVGLHLSELGAVSIRTSLAQKQMQAEISVDHGDLRAAIAAHIPSIQSKLGTERGLHALIQVNQSGCSSSGDGEGSSPRERKEFMNSTRVADAAPELQPSLNLRAPPVTVGGYRLDIRA